MRHRDLAILLCGGAFLGACSKELPPRSVQEFLDDPIMLEAAVVRCAENRAETRYKAECVNARQAVSIIEAREERERSDLLEAQSERKRQALRRTQEAAAEARRRADEAERVRREAEYLAQFGELPPRPGDEQAGEDFAGNVPGAVIPEEAESPSYDEAAAPEHSDDTSNAAMIESQPVPTDLQSIREELQRRGETDSP